MIKYFVAGCIFNLAIHYNRMNQIRLCFQFIVADASGSVPRSGFIWGYNYFLGSRIACESTNNEPPQTLGISSKSKIHSILSNTSPVSVKYQVFILNFTSPTQLDVQFNVRPLIHIGLCLPATCDPLEYYRSIENSIEKSFNASHVAEIYDVKVLYHKEGLDKRWMFLWTYEFYILLTIGAASVVIIFIKSVFHYQSLDNES